MRWVQVWECPIWCNAGGSLVGWAPVVTRSGILHGLNPLACLALALPRHPCVAGQGPEGQALHSDSTCVSNRDSKAHLFGLSTCLQGKTLKGKRCIVTGSG